MAEATAPFTYDSPICQTARAIRAVWLGIKKAWEDFKRMINRIVLTWKNMGGFGDLVGAVMATVGAAVAGALLGAAQELIMAGLMSIGGGLSLHY